MRILYAGMKYDYGNPAQGLSFEHNNFFDALNRCGNDILYFDFATLMRKSSRSVMNRRLAEAAQSEKPDLLFTFLANDEIDREVIAAVTGKGATPTLNWFADDHWRFDNYSRFWAPCFNWVVTTASSAVPKYQAIGYANAIKSQWAANHFQYRKLDLPLNFDATFIGQPHGDRRYMIRLLREAGIDVRCWGTGWEQGRLSQEQMIEVFNQSRINLNFSNPSSTGAAPTFKTRVMATVGKVTHYVPGAQELKAARRRRFARRLAQGPLPALSSHPQIKGRNFEVPGCGGLMLTGMADDLGRYYEPGREAVCFVTPAEMVEQCRAMLADEPRRSAIALAGYERTMREHTYAHRFDDVFRRMGLPHPALARILGGQVKPGQVSEIS